MVSNTSTIADSVIANTNEASLSYLPTVSALSNGSYIIAWNAESDQGGDTSGSSVKAQIFSPLGQKVGSEFLVNSGTRYSQSDPIITEINDQYFLISWTDNSRRGDDPDMHAVRSQKFNLEGEKLGEEILVNFTTAGSQTLFAAESIGSGQVLFVHSQGSGGLLLHN